MSYTIKRRKLHNSRQAFRCSSCDELKYSSDGRVWKYLHYMARRESLFMVTLCDDCAPTKEEVKILAENILSYNRL